MPVVISTKVVIGQEIESFYGRHLCNDKIGDGGNILLIVGFPRNYRDPNPDRNLHSPEDGGVLKDLVVGEAGVFLMAVGMRLPRCGNTPGS